MGFAMLRTNVDAGSAQGETGTGLEVGRYVVELFVPLENDAFRAILEGNSTLARRHGLASTPGGHPQAVNLSRSNEHARPKAHGSSRIDGRPIQARKSRCTPTIVQAHVPGHKTGRMEDSKGQKGALNWCARRGGCSACQPALRGGCQQHAALHPPAPPPLTPKHTTHKVHTHTRIQVHAASCASRKRASRRCSRTPGSKTSSKRNHRIRRRQASP